MQIVTKNPNCSANFIVISMIPFLFFISILLGYLEIIPLNVPLHALAIVGFIFFIFLLFIKHNANYSICKMRATYQILEVELNTNLKKNTLNIDGKNKSILDIDKFLNDYYTDVRNNNFVSVASSIFPMLGILGTFIAIAISMPDFSVTDTASLDKEISILLSGVGSAFYASIYGILLSLIWTYFEKRGLSKVDSYFSSIKNSFKDKIHSNDELLIHKYTQEDIQENKFVNALKETFNLEFIQTVNEQHLNNFTHLATHISNLSNELKISLEQIDKSKSAIDAQTQIQNTLTEFTQATKSFEKNAKIFNTQLDNSLNKTFEKIDTEVGNIVIRLADFATHVSLDSRETQESIKKYHEMIAKQLQDRE